MPVTFAAFPAWKHHTQAYTAFTPERGYQFTQEDFDPLSRQQKLTAMGLEQADDIPGNPLLFGAYIEYDQIKHLGLHEPGLAGIPQFRSSVAAVLERLRFQVFIPSDGTTQRLEAAPDYPPAVEQSIAFFEGFYPLDFGPLPVPRGYEWDLFGGVHLAFPNVPKLLECIDGRLVLAGA